MTTSHRRFLLVALMASLFSGASFAQQLFSLDFDPATLDPGTGTFPGTYGYGYTYAGYGPADCSMNIPATAAELGSSWNHNGSANATADYSLWTDAAPGGPAEVGVACWNYAGYGVGVGRLLAYTDQASGNLIYTEQFTSNDLSQYSITFDAWVEGLSDGSVNPVVTSVDATMNIQFQAPDGAGGFASELTIGTTNNLVNSIDTAIDGNFGSLISLTATPQTFTIPLDSLYELSSELTDPTMGEGANNWQVQGGTGPGSYAAWQASTFWSDTAQFQFQIQPAGDAATFGLDADNVVHIDNYSLTAPFMAIASGLACDFDADGECSPVDLDLLYGNWGIVGGPFDLDASGTVDAGDIGAWLTAASDVANPFNANAKTFVTGDLDFDGDVDSTDLGALLNNFGDGTGLLYQSGNLNDDLLVDSGDLGLLLNNFGATSVAVAAVPEPAGASLLLAALVLIPAILRRRK